MYTLLNKKRYGMASYLAGFLLMLFTPFALSMRVIEEGGGTDTEKEKAALLEVITDRIKAVMADTEKSFVSDEEYKKAKKALDKELADINKCIKQLTDDQMKELKDTIDKQNELLGKIEKASKEQGEELAKLKNGAGSPVQPVSFREALKQALLEKKDIFLTQKHDDNGERLSMKDYFTEKGNKTSPVFTIKNGADLVVNKVAVDMLQSSIIQNYANYMRMTELDAQRVGIPLTIYAHALSAGFLPSKQISRPTMSLLVVYSYEDGAGTKTEGSASSKSSFLFKTVEYKSFNVATYFTLSDETLDDLEEALDEISITAPDKILDKVDDKVFQDGGDGTTDIMGLLVGGTTCTDFDTTDYEDSVVGGNLVDLIATMKLALNKLKYRPDAVVLNGTDILKIESLKDLLNNSIADRRLVFDTAGNLVRIAGLMVKQNDEMTANTCLVLDTKQVMIGIRKAMTLEIGLNGTDFTEGQKTVRLGIRMALGVRDKAALMYSDDMETDKDAIVQVPAA